MRVERERVEDNNRRALGDRKKIRGRETDVSERGNEGHRTGLTIGQMLTPRGDKETDDDSSYGDEGGLVGDVLASEGGGDATEREEDRAAEGGIWGATILRGSDEMSDGRNRDETEERLTFEDRGGWAVVSEDEGAFGRSSELRRQAPRRVMRRRRRRQRS